MEVPKVDAGSQLATFAVASWAWSPNLLLNLLSNRLVPVAAAIPTSQHSGPVITTLRSGGRDAVAGGDLP
jgi:hypothetical protein